MSNTQITVANLNEGHYKTLREIAANPRVLVPYNRRRLFQRLGLIRQVPEAREDRPPSKNLAQGARFKGPEHVLTPAGHAAIEGQNTAKVIERLSADNAALRYRVTELHLALGQALNGWFDCLSRMDLSERVAYEHRQAEDIRAVYNKENP